MNTNNDVEGSGAISAIATKTVEVTYRGMAAKLEVQCSWTDKGDVFSCQAKRYWVTQNNGHNSGNIFLQFSSKETWGKTELTGSATQDGEWHTIEGGGAVEGNGKDARIEFTYIFDVSGGDPTAWNYIDVVF